MTDITERARAAIALSPEAALSAAWTYCAPARSADAFPRGFWPDVAKVAMAMFSQQTTQPILDFRPTMCLKGNSPAPAQRPAKTPRGKISASQKAANTAALLASMQGTKR